MNNIRITLATSSVISLYAVGCFIWKRLRKYKRSPRLNISDNVADLPQELWLIIVEKYLSTHFDTKDILNVALVDKAACQLVEKMYARRISPAQRVNPTQVLITPKLCFFMKRRSEEAKLWLSLNEPKPIYGPWLENNSLKAPETVFKFIMQLIREPKWFKYYLTNGRAMKRVIWNFENVQRMEPLMGVLRAIFLAPFLDYLLNKFTSGEFTWSNLLQINIVEWRTDPFALLMPILMLEASHPLEVNFKNYRGVLFRVVLFAVLAGFHYGVLAMILPFMVIILMVAEPFRYISNDRATAGAGLTAIVSAIFFPATAYSLACLMYTLYDGIMFNRSLPKISYRRNFFLAVGITLAGILWLIKGK